MEEKKITLSKVFLKDLELGEIFRFGRHFSHTTYALRAVQGDICTVVELRRGVILMIDLNYAPEVFIETDVHELSKRIIDSLKK